jgi:hypothetical protein
VGCILISGLWLALRVFPALVAVEVVLAVGVLFVLSFVATAKVSDRLSRPRAEQESRIEEPAQASAG